MALHRLERNSSAERSGLIILARHPRADVRGTMAKDDASPCFVLPQKTDGVTVGEHQVREIQDKDTTTRLGVDHVAQFVHAVGVKLATDPEHNGSAARAKNFQHRPRRSERNCQAIRKALKVMVSG